MENTHSTNCLRSKRPPVQIGAGAPHLNDLQAESGLNSSAERLPDDDSVLAKSIPPEFLIASQAVALLPGINIATLRQLNKDGSGPHVATSTNGRKRWILSSVLEWKESEEYLRVRLKLQRERDSEKEIFRLQAQERMETEMAARLRAELNLFPSYDAPSLMQLIEPGLISFLSGETGESHPHGDRVRRARKLLNRPRARGDWLYVVKVLGIKSVKIGRATNPDERISGIQTSSPLPVRPILVVPGCGDFERDIHSIFAAYRIMQDREWFVWTPTIKQWVLEMYGQILGWSERNWDSASIMARVTNAATVIPQWRDTLTNWCETEDPPTPPAQVSGLGVES